MSDPVIASGVGTAETVASSDGAPFDTTGSSDGELVERAIAGDAAAWAAIVGRYADVVFDTAVAVVGAEHAAGAVVDVFATVRHRLGQLPEPDGLAGWLLAITRVRVLGDTSLLDHELQPGLGPWRAGVSAPEFPAQVVLRGAAASLPARDRLLVELAVVHRIGGRDLARAMGVPTARAGGLKARARRRLRRAVSALMVFRGAEGGSCPTLVAALDDRSHGFDAQARSIVVDHAAECDTCSLPAPPPGLSAEPVAAPAAVTASAVTVSGAAGQVPAQLRLEWHQGWPPAAGAEPSSAVALLDHLGGNADPDGLASHDGTAAPSGLVDGAADPAPDEGGRQVATGVGLIAAALVVVVGLVGIWPGRSAGVTGGWLGTAPATTSDDASLALMGRPASIPFAATGALEGRPPTPALVPTTLPSTTSTTSPPPTTDRPARAALSSPMTSTTVAPTTVPDPSTTTTTTAPPLAASTTTTAPPLAASTTTTAPPLAASTTTTAPPLAASTTTTAPSPAPPTTSTGIPGFTIDPDTGGVVITPVDREDSTIG